MVTASHHLYQVSHQLIIRLLHLSADLLSIYHLHSFRKPGQVFRRLFWSYLSSDKLFQYLQETRRTDLKKCEGIIAGARRLKYHSSLTPKYQSIVFESIAIIWQL